VERDDAADEDAPADVDEAGLAHDPGDRSGDGATLRKHYGKYMLPRQSASEMNKLRAAGRGTGAPPMGNVRDAAKIGSEDTKVALGQ